MNADHSSGAGHLGSVEVTAKLYRGLADPTRLAILLALQHGEQRVVDLVAELGFGLDSAIEGAASIIIVWRFTGGRILSEAAERRAQKAVAITFFLLAPYIAIDALHSLITGEHPSTSWPGIGLSAASLIIMPPLGRAKKHIGARLGSPATVGEGVQNILCAYLAAAVLAGLLANTIFGLWWLDPVIALGIAALAVHEGREAWEGGGEEEEKDD